MASNIQLEVTIFEFVLGLNLRGNPTQVESSHSDEDMIQGLSSGQTYRHGPNVNGTGRFEFG